MIDINKEAEEYSKQFDYPEDSNPSICFIAGANSNYVKQQILFDKIKTCFDLLNKDFLTVYDMKKEITKNLLKSIEELKQLQDG